MPSIRFPVRQTALAGLLCVAGAANATISFVTTTANPAFQAGVTDTFNDLTINSFLGTLSTTRSAGPFRYTVGTTFDSFDFSDLFVAPVAGTVAISTAWFNDALVFSLLSNNVLAFGGNFFATNILGEVASGAMTITVTDSNGLSLTRSISGGSTSAFSGFISDVPLRFASVSLSVPDTNRYASADNVILSAVPEPRSWMLLLAGGAFALSQAARRRG